MWRNWSVTFAYRASITLGLTLLLVAGVATSSRYGDIGNTIAILAYGSFLVGLGLAIVEYSKPNAQSNLIQQKPPRSPEYLIRSEPREKTNAATNLNSLDDSTGE
jgi:hypothetical protein